MALLLFLLSFSAIHGLEDVMLQQQKQTAEEAAAAKKKVDDAAAAAKKKVDDAAAAAKKIKDDAAAAAKKAAEDLYNKMYHTADNGQEKATEQANNLKKMSNTFRGNFAYNLAESKYDPVFDDYYKAGKTTPSAALHEKAGAGGKPVDAAKGEGYWGNNAQKQTGEANSYYYKFKNKQPIKTDDLFVPKFWLTADKLTAQAAGKTDLTDDGKSKVYKGSDFWQQWGKRKAGDTGAEPGKKFLTSGKIDYTWKFHEKSEKSYTKEVTTTADGNLTSSTDTTNASFKNQNDRVINEALIDKSNDEKSKVYKGKSLTKPTTLLQTKKDTTTKTVDTVNDVGFDKLDFKQETSQRGSVGFTKKAETGKYTNQEGAQIQSTQEMPKVTAAKSGTVDVEWRGGDSYTTSKMMHGMKKFIKRASRGDRW